jgi:biotin transport system substrate-specific component
MSTIAQPVVFSDTLPIPKIKVRTAALVVGFALLTALMAQIQIHLSWTPVPITGQTFAVLLAGAALGSRLGALSQITYLVMGLFLPFYAGGDHGWSVVTGASGGYLVGMVVSSFVVGLLAERAQDRTFLTSIPAMLFGSAIVYAIGVPWLAASLDLGAADALEKGLYPFVVGDAIKSLAAGALLPAAWMLTKHDSR